MSHAGAGHRSNYSQYSHGRIGFARDHTSKDQSSKSERILVIEIAGSGKWIWSLPEVSVVLCQPT